MLKPNFKFVTGPSFNVMQEFLGSILELDENGNKFSIRANLNLNRCIPLTSDATEAYEILKKIIQEDVVKDSITLMAGDCLILNVTLRQDCVIGY